MKLGILEQPHVRQLTEPPPALLAHQRQDHHPQAAGLPQEQGTTAEDAKNWKEYLQSSLRKKVFEEKSF
jgi:hypothetical protein